MIFIRIAVLCCAVAIVTSDSGWMRRPNDNTRGIDGYGQRPGPPAFGGRNPGPPRPGPMASRPFGGSPSGSSGPFRRPWFRSSLPGFRRGPHLPPKPLLPGPRFGQRRSPLPLRRRMPFAPAPIGFAIRKRRLSAAVRLGRLRGLLRRFIARICTQRQRGENNGTMENEETFWERKGNKNASKGIDDERRQRYGRDNDTDDDNSRRGRGRMGRRGDDDDNKRGPGLIARKVGNEISRRQDRRNVVMTLLKALIMKNKEENEKKEEDDEDEKSLKELVEKLLDVLDEDDEEDEDDEGVEDEDLGSDDGSELMGESDSGVGGIDDLDTSE